MITNVPAPADWYVYAKMESIAGRGATAPLECSTKRDGEEVDVGDLQIGRWLGRFPGHAHHDPG